MTNDLRTAAETLAALDLGLYQSPTPDDAMIRRGIAVARAWLAEHPADDAESDEQVPESPPNLSFEAVNEFVHNDAQYEYLQWLCLSLATALDAHTDDGEPITEAWLRSIGFEPMEKGSKFLRHRDVPLVAFLGRIMVGNSAMGWHDPEATTRGHLRRLVWGLTGVPLRKPEGGGS